MGDEDKQPSESWSRKLAKALAEHALKSIVTVLLTGFLAWLAIIVGGYYEVIPCGLREWIFGVHC